MSGAYACAGCPTGFQVPLSGSTQHYYVLYL
uniref:Uncharacterized protein n=1 Tax=Anguilla anguilla TaxID=7936 RepID=A0A0E9RPU3_ANGAN